MKSFIFYLLFFSLLLGKTIEEYETEKKVDQLLFLVQKRLSLMHEVAKVKWNQNLPIEDKKREEIILNAISEKTGSNPWIMAFFKAQIESAKDMQSSDFTCWKSYGIKQLDTELSLDASLRAYIDRLNSEMLELLLNISEEDFNHYVLKNPISIRESDSIPQGVWNRAINPVK